jgi:hypothetical protein
MAGLYRDAYLARVGGQFISELVGGDTAGGRLMSSTEWLLPVARLRADLTFRPAIRRPVEEVVAVDTWEGQTW